MATMESSVEIERRDAAELIAHPVLLEAWRALLRCDSNPSQVYAAPEWVEHLLKRRRLRVWVWLVRDQGGRLVAVLPAWQSAFRLTFSVASHVLLRRSLSALHIAASSPLLAPDANVDLEAVLCRLLADCPDCDCLYFDALPTDCALWALLRDSRNLARSFQTYLADGPRPWHLLELSATFDAYLQRMSGKSRSTLRRQVRLLRERGNGDLTLECCTTEAQVQDFLHNATAVSKHSWQNAVLGPRVRDDDEAQQTFADLANRKLLRAYLLKCGGVPCSFVIGYQYEGIYQYAELGFDKDFANSSPGNVLLYLLLEDLHKNDPPRLINFGVGDAIYKQRFGNVRREDSTCLLIRKRLRHRLLLASHKVFLSALSLVKAAVRCWKERKAQPRPSPTDGE